MAGQVHRNLYIFDSQMLAGDWKSFQNLLIDKRLVLDHFDEWSVISVSSNCYDLLTVHLIQPLWVTVSEALVKCPSTTNSRPRRIIKENCMIREGDIGTMNGTWDGWSVIDRKYPSLKGGSVRAGSSLTILFLKIGPHAGNSVCLLNRQYRKVWTHRSLFFVSNMILKPEVVARRAVEVEVPECCSWELSASRVPCYITHVPHFSCLFVENGKWQPGWVGLCDGCWVGQRFTNNSQYHGVASQ
jgi:hypothetical protein